MTLEIFSVSAFAAVSYSTFLNPINEFRNIFLKAFTGTKKAKILSNMPRDAFLKIFIAM